MSAIESYLARPWLAHYEKGVPAAIDAPLKSVHQAFDEAAAAAPGRTAVVFYGRSITFAELREASDRLACALADLKKRSKKVQSNAEISQVGTISAPAPPR